MPVFQLRIETTDAVAGRFLAGVPDAEPVEVEFVPNERLQRYLSGLHDRGHLRYTRMADQEVACAALGEALFEAFFTGSVLDAYRAYEQHASRIRLAIALPSELFYLPWELLRDPAHPEGQFLAAQGSVVRCDAELKDPASILYEPSPSDALLFLLASTETYPLPPFELEDGRVLQVREVRPATFDRFDRRMRDDRNAGFVFFGHGDVEEGRGRLHFVKEERRRLTKVHVPQPIDIFAITDAIGVGAHTRMACLLACETAWARTQVRFSESVVGALMKRTRLSFVVGAQTPIDYYAAREFLFALLHQLDDGDPLDLAIASARRAVRGIDERQVGRAYSRLDWWVPVVYARTTAFDVLPSREALPFPEAAATEGVRARPPAGEPVPAASGGLFLRALGRSLRGWVESEPSVSSALELESRG
jgi:hypothetical protein